MQEGRGRWGLCTPRCWFCTPHFPNCLLYWYSLKGIDLARSCSLNVKESTYLGESEESFSSRGSEAVMSNHDFPDIWRAVFHV